VNILIHELKAGLKPFLFWSIGLFVLVFFGVIKSTGLSVDSAGVIALINSFPRIVLAVSGMADVDISTFAGYYAVLMQYVMLLIAVFAVNLGNSAVSHEMVDKTYEFIFTKPRSRTFILTYKLLACVIYLTAYCLLNFIFSLAAVATLNMEGNLTAEMALFSLVVWILGIVFLSIGVCLAASAKQMERGAKAGNLVILITFVMGVIYNMLENGIVIRFFSPFKYFLPNEVLGGRLDPVFVVVCILICINCLYVAFLNFEKRDLAAV